MTGQTLVLVMCRFWRLRRGPPVTSTSSRGTDTQIRSTIITTRRSGRTIVLDARRNRSPFLFRRATTPCFEASVAVNMLVQNRQEKYRHAYIVYFFLFSIRRVTATATRCCHLTHATAVRSVSGCSSGSSRLFSRLNGWQGKDQVPMGHCPSPLKRFCVSSVPTADKDNIHFTSRTTFHFTTATLA